MSYTNSFISSTIHRLFYCDITVNHLCFVWVRFTYFDYHCEFYLGFGACLIDGDNKVCNGQFIYTCDMATIISLNKQVHRS